jgi:transcriptional regulator with XRE-family HTH domain
MGVLASQVARALKKSRQLPLQLENAEAEDRITLKSLRTAAAALGCELVYALVPKMDSLEQLVEQRARRPRSTSWE